MKGSVKMKEEMESETGIVDGIYETGRIRSLQVPANRQPETSPQCLPFELPKIVNTGFGRRLRV